MIDDIAWYWGNSIGATHTVGTKSANELGIYDMSGNVWEWTNDWYDANYYSNSPANNPQGPATGTDRVIRGGSGWSSAYNCRVAFRNTATPGEVILNLGFRPVFDP